MTTIAYRDGEMAADGRMIQGYAIVSSDCVKIYRRDRDGALAGSAGGTVYAEKFRRWFLEAGEDTPPPEAGETDRGIIAFKNGVIRLYEADGSFVLTDKFTAIGSGKEFALGAMEAGADALSAVEIAARRDPGTGGSLIVLAHA